MSGDPFRDCRTVQDVEGVWIRTGQRFLGQVIKAADLGRPAFDREMDITVDPDEDVHQAFARIQKEVADLWRQHPPDRTANYLAFAVASLKPLSKIADMAREAIDRTGDHTLPETLRNDLKAIADLQSHLMFCTSTTFR